MAKLLLVAGAEQKGGASGELSVSGVGVEYSRHSDRDQP